MAKTSAAGGRSDRPRSPLPPPTGQRTSMRKFIRESWGELRKVQWPTRQTVAQGTIVVGIVTLFFAVYLTAIDWVMVKLVAQLGELINS